MVKQQVFLAPYTTFKIGGPAEWFCEAKNTDELVQALAFAQEKKIPYFILGNGSNILVSDAGFRGLAIRFVDSKFKMQDSKISAAAGLPLQELVDLAAQSSLTGLEFLAGIPGSVGGSVRGNAGAWQQSLGDQVTRVQILDQSGKISWLDQKTCQFSYRQSRFKQNAEIILAVELQLQAGSQTAIKAKMADYRQRRASQPQEPSAGCVFINPANSPRAAAGQVPTRYSAGQLIEACGLKGRQIGQAQISPQHANFIVNLGGAKAADVLTLIKLVQTTVKEKFQIDLQLEIQLVGFNNV